MPHSANHLAAFQSLLPLPEAKLTSGFANYLRNGLTPVSEDTIRTYMGELRTYLRLQDRSNQAPVASYVSRANLIRTIAEFPQERASSRRNMFYAVKSFARYLRDLDLLDERTFEQIAAMKLTSRHEPVRRFMTPRQVETVIQAILANPDCDEVERLTNLAIFATLALTGLRNSELCRLRLIDVDFERGMLTVYRGKGNKTRVIGLPDRLVPLLRLYLQHRPTSTAPYFFVGPGRGTPLNRDAIVKRFGRLSRRLGFKIGAHMCRRSFATHRAHAGVPLDKLQVVMGHVDIKTTRMYVQTRESAVAAEMRSW